MTALWIVGILLAIFLVVQLSRVGVRLAFGEEFRVMLRLGPIRMQVVPKKETAKKKPKKDKATKKKKEKPKEVLVRNGNRTRSVSADDIYYIESSNRKVTLYLRHEKIEYYDKISSLESELKPDFFRIHKGYLVNIKYVERYDRTEVKMRNGDSLLISKYKYQDFVKRYLEYISEER